MTTTACNIRVPDPRFGHRYWICHTTEGWASRRPDGFVLGVYGDERTAAMANPAIASAQYGKLDVWLIEPTGHTYRQFRPLAAHA